MKMLHYIVNMIEKSISQLSELLLERRSIIKYRSLMNLSVLDIVYFLLKLGFSINRSPSYWEVHNIIKVSDPYLAQYIVIALMNSDSLLVFLKNYSTEATMIDKYSESTYYNQLELMYKENKVNFEDYFKNKE